LQPPCSGRFSWEGRPGPLSPEQHRGGDGNTQGDRASEERSFLAYGKASASPGEGQHWSGRAAGERGAALVWAGCGQARGRAEIVERKEGASLNLGTSEAARTEQGRSGEQGPRKQGPAAQVWPGRAAGKRGGARETRKGWKGRTGWLEMAGWKAPPLAGNTAASQRRASFLFCVCFVFCFCGTPQTEEDRSGERTLMIHYFRTQRTRLACHVSASRAPSPALFVCVVSSPLCEESL